MILALFLTLIITILNFTTPLMAGHYIVSDLGGNLYLASYAVAFFCLGNAVTIPLSTLLTSHMGTSKTFCLITLFFALFTFLAADAPNYPVFLIFRFVQGLITGPLYMMINRVMGLVTPVEHKKVITSLTLSIFTATPAFGACLGGWLAYDYIWRYAFYSFIPVLIVLAIFFYTRDIPDPEKPQGFDGLGFFLYALGLTSFGTVCIMVQELDWYRSQVIVTLFLIACFSLPFFLMRSLMHPFPVLNFRLLKHLPFSFAMINVILCFSLYFGTVILLALWLSFYANYTPLWIALLIGVMALAALLPSFLLFKPHDIRLPLALALVLFAISSFHTSLFNVEINFGRIAFSRAIAGFALAFFLPPLFRLAYRSFPEEKVIEGGTWFHVVRVLSSGLGAAIYVIVWHRRQVFYRSRLGSNLTAFSEETKLFFLKAKERFLTGLPADAKLDYYLERQATALALDDCFYLMGWLMIGLLGLLLMSLTLRKEPFTPESFQKA